MARRPGWELLLINLALGPLIGGSVFVAIIILCQSLWSANTVTEGARIMFRAWPLVFVASYMLGAVPVVLNALAGVALSRYVERAAHRVLLAPVTGAVTAMIGLSWLVIGKEPGAVPPALFLLAGAAAGAVSALACALLAERFARAGAQNILETPKR